MPNIESRPLTAQTVVTSPRSLLQRLASTTRQSLWLPSAAFVRVPCSCVLLLGVLLLGPTSAATPESDSTSEGGRIVSVAGTGLREANATRTPLETNLGNPFGVEIGPNGDLYICEVDNHRVWRMTDPRSVSSSPQLQLVAGCGKAGYSGDGGPATQACLREPYEIRFDGAGNTYFVEMKNHLVRKIDREGNIHTVAGTGTPGFGGDGGPALDAMLNRPHSIALDGQGALFIADIGNHRIRRVDLARGTIETFAGNEQRELPIDGGEVANRPVLGPRALYITDRTLWVALREGHSLWKIDLDNPRWRAVAGTGEKGFTGDGGPARKATFNGPKGVVVDQRRNIYIVDTENQAIRRIDADNGIISTVAGSGPSHRGFVGENTAATAAHLNRPHGICVDAHGALYIGDSENHRVRRIELKP